MQESNRIEFKAVLNDKLEKEIVAFLNNHEGGVLYIGVKDDGHPIKTLDMDSVHLKLLIELKTIFCPHLLGCLMLLRRR